MKYWNELIELETEIIKLDVLHSVIRLVCNGVDSSPVDKDIQLAMWHIQEQLLDISNNITVKYSQLFDNIREDEVPFDKKYHTDELSNIVSQWIQTK